MLLKAAYSWQFGWDKGHIFWEGHKILWNLPLTFDWHYIGQKQGEDFSVDATILKKKVPKT